MLLDDLIRNFQMDLAPWATTSNNSFLHSSIYPKESIIGCEILSFLQKQTIKGGGKS